MALKTSLPPNELARLESDLRDTNDRIKALDRKIDETRRSLQEKKIEKAELRRKLRDARLRRQGQPETQAGPAKSPGLRPALRQSD